MLGVTFILSYGLCINVHIRGGPFDFWEGVGGNRYGNKLFFHPSWQQIYFRRVVVEQFYFKVYSCSIFYLIKTILTIVNYNNVSYMLTDYVDKLHIIVYINRSRERNKKL